MAHISSSTDIASAVNSLPAITSKPGTKTAPWPLTSLPFDIQRQICRHVAESLVGEELADSWDEAKYTYTVYDTIWTIDRVLNPLLARRDLYLLGMEMFCRSHAMKMTAERLHLLSREHEFLEQYGDFAKAVRNIELDITLTQLRDAGSIVSIRRVQQHFPGIRLLHVCLTDREAVEWSQDIFHSTMPKDEEGIAEIRASFANALDQLRRAIIRSTGKKIKLHLSQLGFGQTTTVTNRIRASSHDIAVAFLRDMSDNETWHLYNV